MTRNFWTRRQTVVLLKFYLSIDPNKAEDQEESILNLSKLIGRNTHAIKMKIRNFASLDPDAASKGIISSNTISQNDKKLWDMYYYDRDELEKECAMYTEQLIQMKKRNGYI